MRIAALLLLAALSVQASQIFHMDLEDVLGMARSILLAEVEEAEHSQSEYSLRMDYVLRVLDHVHGPDTLSGVFPAFYTQSYPMSWVDEDGVQVWESPIVEGSGMETGVSAGDRVLVLVGYIPEDSVNPVSIVRMEPADSLPAVLRLLDQMGRS